MDRARKPRPRFVTALVVERVARGRRRRRRQRERRARRRGRESHVGHGTELDERGSAHALVQREARGPTRAAPSCAQQRCPRARADLHRRGPHGERAGRHRVRAVGDRDRLVRVPRRGPDPTRLQQLRGHQREQWAAQGHDLRGRSARRTRALTLLPDTADRCARADPTPARLRRPSVAQPAQPLAHAAERSHRAGAVVGVLRRNSPSGKLIWASAPDYGIRILQLFSGA